MVSKDNFELRVLHSISYAENGGAQVVIDNLISEGDKVGIESHLVFINTQKTVPSCITHSENIEFISGNKVKNLLSLVSFIKRKKIDILHSHTNPERRLMSIASILTRKPHVYHVHTRMEIEGAFRPRKNFLKKIVRQVIRRYGISTIIATSELVESDIKSYLVKNNMIRIEPGINFVKFRDLPKSDARKALGLSLEQGRILVGCPSRLEDKKGIENLVEAVSTIDDIDLVILGTGSKKEKYEKLCSEVGILGRTKFIDRSENMPAFYSACDIIVAPSFEESFSLVFLEAIASTRPVVASNIAPFDFARNYVTRFKVGDSLDLELKLKGVISKLENDFLETPNLETLQDQFSMQKAALKVQLQYRQVKN